MTATATRARPRARPATAIPGPQGHPLLGMVRALRANLLGTLQDGFARYGDVVAYRVGPAHGPRSSQRLVVALRHPDDVRRTIVDTDVFVRRAPSYDVLRELFGETLVTMEHARWRRQKRILQPLFTRRHVAQYAALIEAEADRVVTRHGHGDQPVDVTEAMERYALRVLGQTLFAGEDGIDAETVAALERLVPRVSSQVTERATQPLRLPLRLPTARNRRFLALRAELHATIDRVLERRERCGGDDAREEADLLTRLRAARDPHDGAALTPREVRDEALMLLLAGHTTTSNALTSTLHFLGRDPAVQEQVAATAMRAAGEVPRQEDLVRAAVQEAMRLHPPAYVLGRRAARDVELAGYALPAGTLVLACPWATHRHPALWEEPERYDPTRFLGEQERPAFAYMPFSGGGRACIGRHLALLEATILLRALLRRYRLESLEATMAMSPLISMRPAGPVHVRFHPCGAIGGCP